MEGNWRRELAEGERGGPTKREEHFVTMRKENMTKLNQKRSRNPPREKRDFEIVFWSRTASSRNVS